MTLRAKIAELHKKHHYEWEKNNKFHQYEEQVAYAFADLMLEVIEEELADIEKCRNMISYWAYEDLKELKITYDAQQHLRTICERLTKITQKIK